MPKPQLSEQQKLDLDQIGQLIQKMWKEPVGSLDSYLDKIFERCRRSGLCLGNISVNIGKEKSEQRLTLLHLMAMRGRVDLVKKLVNHEEPLIKIPRKIKHPTQKSVAQFAVETGFSDRVVYANGEEGIGDCEHNENINKILDLLCVGVSNSETKHFISLASKKNERSKSYPLARAAAKAAALSILGHIEEMLQKHQIDLFEECPDLMESDDEESESEEMVDEQSVSEEKSQEVAEEVLQETGEQKYPLGLRTASPVSSLATRFNLVKIEPRAPLTKNEILEVIKILRAGNNAQANCSILTRHLMKFFETRIMPAEPAVTREATLEDCAKQMRSGKVKVKIEPGTEMKVEQAVSSKLFIQPNSILVIPQPELPYLRLADNSAGTRIDVDTAEAFEHKVRYTEVTAKILAAAKEKGGELWGTINFYRLHEGADSHEAAFYCDARTGEVWFIESQDYNGIDNTGEPFVDLARRYSFISEQSREEINSDDIDDIFGDYVFWYPYGSRKISTADAMETDGFQPSAAVAAASSSASSSSFLNSPAPSAAHLLVASMPFLTLPRVERGEPEVLPQAGARAFAKTEEMADVLSPSRFLL